MDTIPGEIIILIIGEIRDYTNFSNFRSTCKRIKSICDECQEHKWDLFVKEGPTNFFIQFKVLLKRLFPGPYHDHDRRIPGEVVKGYEFSRDMCCLQFLRQCFVESIFAIKVAVECTLGKKIDTEEMKSFVSITTAYLEEDPDINKWIVNFHIKLLNTT